MGWVVAASGYSVEVVSFQIHLHNGHVADRVFRHW